MHNVEVYNCSQANTMKAAIRFEGASSKWSHVKGCSVHNGHGWALNVYSSANVKIEKTIVYSFKPFGVVALSVSNFTFDNNIVAHIEERPSQGAQKFVDPRGAVNICSINENNVCRDVKITNNIVAGGAYTGFAVMGHDCGAE